MGTIGEAYNVAMEMSEAIGSEALWVATESADVCRKRGDESGFRYWNFVAAFVAYLSEPGSRTVH